MSVAGAIMSMHSKTPGDISRVPVFQLLLAAILFLCLPSIGQGAGTVVVSFGAPAYTVSEAAGVVEIDLHISDAPDQQVGVFFVTNRSGTSDDFDSAIWEPGDAAPKIISFDILDDNIVDPTPVTFTVSISDWTGDVSFAGPSFVTVTVLDDDPPAGSTLSIFSGDGQDATVSSLAPLVVEVRSPLGDAIENALVTWSVFPAGAASLQGNTATNSDGLAENNVAINQFGIGTITVTAVGQGAGVVEFTIQTGFGDLPPPLVTLLKISGDFGGNAEVGSQHTLVLQALEPEGEPLSEREITWSVDPPDAAALIDDTTFTDSEGLSSNVLTVVDRPGVITVTAGSPGLGSVQFTISSFGLGTAPGLTNEQRSLGTVLENACEALDGRTGQQDLSDGEQGLLDVCNGLADADPNEVKNALDQIMPKKSLAQGTLALEGNKRQHTNVKSRLSALRSGAKGFSFSGFNVNYAGQSVPGLVFAQLADAAKKGGGASADADDGGIFGARLGGFVNGSVSFGDRNATAAESGFDFTTRGLTAGLDYRFTNELIAGATIGLVRNNTDFDGSGGKTEADGYSLSVFGTWYRSQQLYVDGILSIGRNDYDMNRRIVFGATDTIARSSTDGSEYSLGIGGGYELNRGALTFGPYGRLNYVRASIDGYRERPAGGLEMIVGKQNVDSLVTLIGGQVSQVVSTSQGVLSPYMRFEWAHEFKPDGRTVSARFVNDPNSGSFRFSSDREDGNYFNLGLGVSAMFARGRAGFLDYERMIGRKHMTQHTITAGFRMEF